MKIIGNEFENLIKGIILSHDDKFSEIVFNKNLLNVLNFSEYKRQHPYENFNTLDGFIIAINKEKNDIILFKNFPRYNKIGRTEFCVVHKVDNIIYIWRIECKFQKVVGTAYEKNAGEISYYRDNKINSKETQFVLVYDGDFYERNPNIIKDILKTIQNDIDILFLNVPQFKEFLTDYLNAEANINEVFKKHHSIIMKII
jgi:hypothetical protein